MGGGKGDSPDPPDYKGAAEAEAAASKEITEAQTWANRPTQITPWGTVTWEAEPTSTQGPSQTYVDPWTGQVMTIPGAVEEGPDKWTQTVSLSPQQQAALDSQMGLQQGRSDLALSLMGRAANEFAPIMDWSQFTNLKEAPEVNRLNTNVASPTGAPGAERISPTGAASAERVNPLDLSTSYDFSGAHNVSDPTAIRQNAEDSIYSKATSRLDPQFERRSNDLEVKLRSQGLRPGDEAYDRAMREFEETRNDAYDQARMSSIIGGGEEAQRQFGMDIGLRQQDIGEATSQGNFGNQALSNMFSQRLGAADQYFGQDQAARQQAYAQALSSSGQYFDQDAASKSMAYQQAQDAASKQFGQEQIAGNQYFNQQLGAADYTNKLRQQQIAEEMQRRGFSLNEINAIITGQQVGMPQQPTFNTATKSETPQYLSAANMQYQTDMDKYSLEQSSDQALMSGIGTAAMFMSDRRLKRNIVHIGCTKGGTKVYLFDYIWGAPSIGVMADEVPYAVAGQINGYDFVDYSKVL